jgi:hypothetical protein
MTKQHRYLSYLLRMWQTSDGKKTVWRASLQSPGSEEQHGFASLEELTDFIKTQAERAENSEQESPESHKVQALHVGKHKERRES